MKRLAALYICLTLLAAPALAQAPLDNIDYLSDGVMTQDEMEQEAAGVERMCNLNAYQNELYDCGCFSAAFLIERERLGPLPGRQRILLDLTGSEKIKSCINAPNIAGNFYRQCRSYMANYNDLNRNVEPYCDCVGNRVARQFGKRPAMSPDYMAVLYSHALSWCENPANQPKRTSAASP